MGGGARRTADRPSRPSSAPARGVGVLEGPGEGGWARPAWESVRGRLPQLSAQWGSRPVTGTPPPPSRSSWEEKGTSGRTTAASRGL